MPLSKMAMTPNIAPGVNLPSVTNVAGEETMMSAFFNPIKAMNMPMPTDMAYLKFSGMALSMASRTLMNVISRKTMPSMSIMASDCCQV